MSRFRFGLVSLVLCLAAAAPANAQSGLYEPFPSAAQSKRAERFVGKLGAPTELSDLRRGTFTASELEPVAPGVVTARAGVANGGGGPAWFWFAAGALLAGLLAPSLRALAGRRG